MNVLVLAYIGDSIYELKVRNHFISLGNVNEIQKVVIKYYFLKESWDGKSVIVFNNLILFPSSKRN